MNEKKYKIKLRVGDFFENSKISLNELMEINERFLDSGFRIYPRSNEQLSLFKFSAATDRGLILCNDPYYGGRLLTYDQIMELAEPEPQTGWNGEGLPPVGTECEAWDWDEKKWVSGVFIMKGNSDHAFATGSNKSWGKLFWAAKFRPLKTERERAIEAAIKPILRTQSELKSPKWASAIAEELYDAGLLKEPEQSE